MVGLGIGSSGLVVGVAAKFDGRESGAEGWSGISPATPLTVLSKYPIERASAR